MMCDGICCCKGRGILGPEGCKVVPIGSIYSVFVLQLFIASDTIPSNTGWHVVEDKLEMIYEYRDITYADIQTQWDKTNQLRICQYQELPERVSTQYQSILRVDLILPLRGI